MEYKVKMIRITFLLIICCLSELSFSKVVISNPFNLSLANPMSVNSRQIEGDYSGIRLPMVISQDDSPVMNLKPYTKELERAAKSGNAAAMVEVGKCYLFGNGVDENNKKAQKWFEEAIELNNADALFGMGYMYEKGKAKKIVSASFFTKLGMERGAIRSLANEELEARNKAAESLYNKATIYNQPDAWFWRYCQARAKGESFNQALIAAAEGGNMKAQYEYGAYFLNQYKSSPATTSHLTTAKEWFSKVAEQGHEQAIRDLAAIREKEIQDSLAQVRIEEERLRVQEEERKRIQEEKLKWGNLSVQLKKPGTLLSVIPIDKLQYIDSLTITGILYETDLKVITEQCKGLKKLDLSNCYTLYSPEELKKQRDQQEALVGLVKAMGVAANMKYNDYNMSTNDYVYTKLFTKLVEQAGKEPKSDDACVIPNYAFERMPCLEEIVFPTRCSEIGRYVCYKCTQLKKVILPKYVKRMDFASFSFCPNLAEVEFPRTLKSIGLYDNSGDNRPGSFTRTGIKVVDLSKCNFGSKYSDSWTFFFTDCPNIQAVYLPNGVPNIDVRVGSKGAVCYVPASVKYLKYSCFSEYHFKSLVPPSGDILPKNCTIYVPKGCTTAYFAKYGSSNKYIEE